MTSKNSVVIYQNKNLNNFEEKKSIVIDINNEKKKTNELISYNNLNLKIIDESVKRSEEISNCRIKISEESKNRANDVSLLYKLIYNNLESSEKENKKLKDDINKININLKIIDKKLKDINNKKEDFIEISNDNLDEFEKLNMEIINIKNDLKNKTNDNKKIEEKKNNLNVIYNKLKKINN